MRPTGISGNSAWGQTLVKSNGLNSHFSACSKAEGINVTINYHDASLGRMCRAKMFHRQQYLDIHGVGGIVAFTNCIVQVTDSIVRIGAGQEICPFCTKASAKWKNYWGTKDSIQLFSGLQFFPFIPLYFSLSLSLSLSLTITPTISVQSKGISRAWRGDSVKNGLISKLEK